MGDGKDQLANITALPLRRERNFLMMFFKSSIAGMDNSLSPALEQQHQHRARIRQPIEPFI